MVVHIIIAGESQCDIFAQICLVADYISQKLPQFCYERLEKSVLDWPVWLYKINMKNNWHHLGSPIIWKELLMKGSTPYYIGGATEFLEYCHSYYNFDLFMGFERYQGLVKNFGQYKKKLKQEELRLNALKESLDEVIDTVHKDAFVICISGASCPLTSLLISRLLDMSNNSERSISKIFIYDDNCSAEALQQIETECSFIGTLHPGKVVKYADKIGNALPIADLLIVLDHVPFNPKKSIGEWLHANMKLMQNLAIMINASASRAMYIIFANLGPACFNATVLMHSVTTNIRNIVVATSDVGLEVMEVLAENTEVSCRRMFCPPVWGFVGINHLADVKTTIHEYNTFEPYTRYTRVQNSTLNIGSVTPEIRTMEYLTHFDDTIWTKVNEKRKILPKDGITMNKAVAILNLIRVWLMEPSPPDYIVNLGLLCDGSFGLTFDGAFSQPCRLYDREWRPAKEFFEPKDNYMKLPYMQYMAELIMKIGKTDLPPIVPFFPCICKREFHHKKGVWYPKPEFIAKLAVLNSVPEVKNKSRKVKTKIKEPSSEFDTTKSENKMTTPSENKMTTQSEDKMTNQSENKMTTQSENKINPE